MKIDENNIFTVITVGSMVLLAIFVVTGALLVSIPFAVGTAVGGVIAVVNGRWLFRILQQAMKLPPRQAVRFTQLRYVTRLGIIAVIVSLLILYVNIDVFGLLLGLSVLVASIMIVAVYMALHNGG